ncbi:MAG: putative DNA binding domain-containing protein [Melioribacter sp.]|nr:putative DNA binding domain-containing protein [Melioribacter sp.]
MNRKKVLELIEMGEGLHVEYKQRFSTHEKIAKSIIAFANTSGGVILIGVDDDKSIYGIASEKSDTELVNETAVKYCAPPVVCNIYSYEIENKEVMAVEIPESGNKPHRIQDYKSSLDLNTAQVYVRVNDKSVFASKEMIKLLQTEQSKKSLVNYSVGKNEKIVFEYLEKNEKISVKELSKIANISDRRASRTLIKLVRANLLLIHVKDNGENYFTSVV